MVKLRKLLSDSSKAKRHRRLKINIHITFLAWLAECFGSSIVFIGLFVYGHQSHIVEYSLEIISFVVYLNILPCVLLLNDDTFKGKIADSYWYNAFLNVFHCQYTYEAENIRGEET